MCSDEKKRLIRRSHAQLLFLSLSFSSKNGAFNVAREIINWTGFGSLHSVVVTHSTNIPIKTIERNATANPGRDSAPNSKSGRVSRRGETGEEENERGSASRPSNVIKAKRFPIPFSSPFRRSLSARASNSTRCEPHVQRALAAVPPQFSSYSFFSVPLVVVVHSTRSTFENLNHGLPRAYTHTNTHAREIGRAPLEDVGEHRKLVSGLARAHAPQIERDETETKKSS